MEANASGPTVVVGHVVIMEHPRHMYGGEPVCIQKINIYIIKFENDFTINVCKWCCLNNKNALNDDKHATS